MENSRATSLQSPRNPAPATFREGPGDALDETLARFCADQHFAFDPGTWLQRAPGSGGALPFLARYLAGTSWYGHSEELESVARLADEQAGTPVGAEGIDIARYSGAIRLHIARRRLPGPVTEASEEV